MRNHDEIVALLRELLANTYLLYIQTQGAHWNVVGSNFPQLHTLFQTQYTELNLATDLIAEHLRTYGAMSPASALEFSRYATLQETDYTKLGQVDDQHHIDALIASHKAAAETATRLGAITVNKLNTQNLAADRIDAHEKAIWMLKSTRAAPLPSSARRLRRRNPLSSCTACSVAPPTFARRRRNPWRMGLNRRRYY